MAPNKKSLKLNCKDLALTAMIQNEDVAPNFLIKPFDLDNMNFGYNE